MADITPTPTQTLPPDETPQAAPSGLQVNIGGKQAAATPLAGQQGSSQAPVVSVGTPASTGTNSGTADAAPVVAPPTNNEGVVGRLLDAVSGATSTIKDMGRGGIQGIANGVIDTAETADHLATAGTNALIAAGVPNPTITIDSSGVHFTNEKTDTEGGELDRAANSSGIEQTLAPRTLLGHMTESTTQFLTGMAIFGGVGGTAEAFGATHVGAELLKAGLASGVATQTAGGNLSDVIQSYPALRNPVTQFLQADPNDNEAVARLKLGIEGVVTGAVGEGLFAAIRAFKDMRAGDVEGTIQASKEIAPHLAKAQEPLPAPAIDLPPTTPSEAPKGNTIEVPKGKRAILINVPKEAERLTDEELQRYFDQVGGATSWIDHGAEPHMPWLNPNRFPDGHTIGGTISAQQAAVGAEKGAIGGPRSWDKVKRIADRMALTPEQVLADTQAAAQLLENVDSVVNLAANALTSQAAVVERLARMMANAAPGEYENMETLFNVYVEAVQGQHLQQLATKRIGTALGRGLGAQKIVGKIITAFQHHYVPASYTKEAMLRHAEGIVAMSDGSIRSVFQAMRSMSGQLIEKGNHILINSLLGIPTATVKVTTDVMMMIVTPLEHSLSGAYQAVGGAANGFVEAGLKGASNQAAPGIARFREGLQYFASYLHYAGDAMMMSAKAFKLGKQISAGEAAHSVEEPFSGGMLNNLMVGRQGPALVNAVSNFVTLPSRIIGSIDEFSKHLAYRAEVFRLAQREIANEMPENLSAAEQAKWANDYVTKRMGEAFSDTGKYTDREAWHFAETQTNTQSGIRDASKLSFGATKSLNALLSDAAGDIPIIRQVMPFIKVVMNIQRWQWTRTPGLQLLQKELRSDLLAGGERTADAMAKLTTAGLIATLGYTLAAAGYITGTLHADPAVQAEIERDTGKRHDSWVISHPDGTKDYIPLSRFADPIGPLLAQAATLHQISKYIPEHEWWKLCSAWVAMIGHGIEDKAYFQGMANAYQAIMGTADPDATKGDRVTKFVAQYLAGYVPNILSNHLGGPDKYMREINGYLDGVIRKLPGSPGVDPVRNDLGERVRAADPVGPGDLSPFQSSSSDRSVVAQELGRQLAMGDKPIPRNPKIISVKGISSGIDTTKIPGGNGHSGYDRMGEIMSTMTDLDGNRLVDERGQQIPTLREMMEKTLADGSPYWTKESDSRGQYMGSRRMDLDSIIGQYHSIAQKQLIKENPFILEAIKQNALNSQAQRLGKPLPYPGLLKQSAFQGAIAPSQQPQQ